MRDNPRSILIFAAGLGRRMLPLTARTPKPLIQVAGRTLLDHALDQARDAGIERIVVNTHYLAEKIAAHLSKTGVLISHEPKLLETGGGLRAALPLLGSGPVMTLNSDAVWCGGNPLATLLSDWRASNAHCMLSCVPKSRAHGHKGTGDFIVGPPVQRGRGVIYTGAHIIDPAGIETVSDEVFSLNQIWDRHLCNGQLELSPYPGHWVDVGQPASIQLAEQVLAGV